MSILFSHFLSQNNEIAPQEADFTEVLASIALAPKMLYFYGKMPENRGFGVDKRPPTVAIVGTRKPTKYGEMVAHELAYAVAKRGGVVVSGLAYGIDSIAHRGALEAGGVTVAVLGTPIDQIYPRAHQGLAEKIVETGGCVMSELPPGAVHGRDYHAKTCFLRRNRLISGLSDVVVIPEAAERSGSLNTAAHALEQGREIFVVPGDITRPMSKGCNRLICQGATPYLGVEDVLEVLFPGAKGRAGSASGGPGEASRGDTEDLAGDKGVLVGDTEAETAILRALLAGMRDGEEILAQTGLEVTEFSQAMTMLEIKGQVRALGMNKWMLRG